MRVKKGDVLRFVHDPKEPHGPWYDGSGHTALVLDVFDELGDDLNEHTVTMVWSTAGTIGASATLSLSTVRKHYEHVTPAQSESE